MFFADDLLSMPSFGPEAHGGFGGGPAMHAAMRGGDALQRAHAPSLPRAASWAGALPLESTVISQGAPRGRARRVLLELRLELHGFLRLTQHARARHAAARRSAAVAARASCPARRSIRSLLRWRTQRLRP